MEETISALPSASDLIESLRDIGYSMETAVADIIDNSITAEASRINIEFLWNDGSPWVCIADNGFGMSFDELKSAMRHANQNPDIERNDKDLGRFGLGLKTASFSQCRQLTVLSKKNGIISALEWNLDWLKENPEAGWSILKIPSAIIDGSSLLSGLQYKYLSKSDGTIVLWRKLDRFDESQEKMNSLFQRTRNHLELVFHRYLSPGPGQKGIDIHINNDPVEAFNPFFPTHPATQELPSQNIHLDNIVINVQPYVLPHYNKSSREDYEKYAGVEGYLQNQGFYVYRNKRLIIKGTWFRLIKKEELTKLIRVQIDIPNSLDHLWKIDVKKSNASPPESIKKELRSIIDKIATSGKRVYQRRGKKLRDRIKEPAWNRLQKDGSIQYIINRDHYLVSQLENQLTSEQQLELKTLISMIEGSFPAELFYSDVAKTPETLSKPDFISNTYSLLLDAMIQPMIKNSISPEKIIERILSCDPFASYPEETEKLLKEKGILNE